MLLQDIVQKNSELKKSLTPLLQYIDFTILGIDRSIVRVFFFLKKKKKKKKKKKNFFL